MKTFLLSVALGGILTICACVAADKALLPTKPGEDSQAQTVAKAVKDAVPSPYGEIGLVATNLTTLIYMLIRGKQYQNQIDEHQSMITGLAAQLPPDTALKALADAKA